MVRPLLLVTALTLPAFAAVDFNREIRPILSDNCFKCHGPDEQHRMANLRLDIHDGGAFAQRTKGPLIIPGDAAKSTLYQRVSNPDKNRRMPPPNAELTLTATQIQLIKQWIDEGAKWETHWAFSAPTRPAVPPVKDAAWPKNPIDNFVLARLESEGLKPSPEADRITLLRRVTFDLTGLPPTPEEVAAFLADKSPDAYERQVDRLLHSPHYGERMAMQWLDLARYADSHGYHIDSHRDMWPWRDWVIRAYNDNMPFDRFTVLQLAGDLLPNPTNDDKIATGFNRNHMINFEGGAIPEEYLVEYAVDRVEATSNTWMGLTMGCARCHSHKYDPISHKEFYQFYAFFNSISEKGLDGKTGNAAPFLQLPTPEQEARTKELVAGIKSAEAAVNAQPVTDAIAQWKASLAGKPVPVDHNALAAHYQMDGSLADSSGHYLDGRTLKGDPTFGEGQIAKAVSFDGQTVVTLGNAGAFKPTEPFSVALWVRPPGSKQPEPIFEKIADSRTRQGYELWFGDPILIGIQDRAAPIEVRITSAWPRNTLRVRTRDHYPRADWKHFAFTYDGSGKAAGLKLYVDGKPAQTEILSDTLVGQAVSPGGFACPAATMPEYRRRLPHYHPNDVYLFLAWRLWGSLPAKAEPAVYATPGHAFAAHDRVLDRPASGPLWLRDPRIADLVCDAVLIGDCERHFYRLSAWVVMPNHVHLLILPLVPPPVLMRWLKGSTARNANRILDRAGQPFWRDESYDHSLAQVASTEPNHRLY